MDRSPIRTILFDLDGTLVDSRADLTAAVNAALKATGQPPKTAEEVVPHVGNGLRVLLNEVMGAVLEPTLNAATVAFSAYYDVHCVDETVLYDGVLETLERLNEKAKLGVITNKPHRFAEKILKKLGVARFLESVIGGDTLPERKPHPAPVFKGIHDLRGERVSALVVGDGIQDIMAGQAAGVRTCIARYGYGFNKDVLKLKPDYTLNHFKDLKEIVT